MENYASLLDEIAQLRAALEIIKNIAPSTCTSVDNTCCCIRCIAIEALAYRQGATV